MKIVIQNVHIYTVDGEETVFTFSNFLTFIYGNVGTGKSTIINLIMYAFGCNLTYTPAINNCLKAVQLRVLLNGKPFLFFRMANSNRIQINDIMRNQRFSLLHNQISSFLYKQFALPDLYLSMGNIEDKKVKLSFTNFCWFSYLKQSEMDNNFFYMNSDNIYKQNAAVNVLSSFFESEFLINQDANQKYRKLKRRLRQFEDCHEVFKYLEKIFYNDDILSEPNPILTVAQLKYQITNALSDKFQYYTNNDLHRLLNLQKRVDQLEYRISFELRQERYQKELDCLRNEMENVVTNIRLNQSEKNPNVQRLYNLFLDCLINIGFHGVTKFDSVRMDSKTYMPILSNSYEKQEVSFENLGSGGKKTMFKICFALAVHRLQHAKLELNYLPSFLIIDTPMKNISEREDFVLYDRFYQYLLNLFSTELSDTQLFVIDKEKRDLKDYKFNENVVLMKMTHDDWMNPPLFKNYKGL